MRNLDIIYEANQLSSQSKGKIIPIMLFTGILAIIPSILSEIYWLMFILLLAFIAVSHGNLTACLKVYHGQGDEVETYEDGLYGLKNLPQLFGTYFKYNFIKVLMIIVVAIAVTYLSISMVGEDIVYYFSALENASIYSDMYLFPEELFAAIGLIFVYFVLPILIISFVIHIIYDLYFFPTFYLLQEEDERGFGAMLNASKLMKGNKWQLFKLKLSYFGWMILAMIIAGVIGAFMGSLGTLSTLIASIIGVIVGVLVYQVRYQLAMTIFYKEVINKKEIDLFDFERINRYKIGDEEVVNEHLVEDDKTEYNEIFTKRDLFKGVGIFLPLYLFIIPLLMNVVVIGMNISSVEKQTMILNVGSYFLTFSFLLILYKRHFISIIRYIKQIDFVPFFKYVLTSVVICYMLSIVGSLMLIWIQGPTVTGNQEVGNRLLASFPFITFIMTVFLAPIIEEFIFRGILYNCFKKYGVIIAMLGSCLMFGLMHVFQYLLVGQWYRLIEIIPYALMSSIFVVVYEKKKSLTYPIFVHIFYNMITTFLLFSMMK